MKNIFFKNLTITVLILVLSGFFYTGYSQKKSAANPANSGVKLEYKYPEGKTFKYISDTKVVQDLDVNGQSMLVNIAMYMGCEVKAARKTGDNLNLEITIDSMSQNIESPQGTAGGPIVDVKGKSFNMVISPAGKTLDVAEAAKVIYNIEGSGENNMVQAFLNYFPSLPKGSVNPGDTWVFNDTIDSKAPNNTMWMPVESRFKFEGIETIEGIECAKITADLSGIRKMTTQSQGMEIHTAGPYTGTQVLYFALKDGYLVRESVNTKMTGTIEIPDQNMTFPVVMTVNSNNEVVK
jgi:cell division protein YceG involved in septum cleavage